MTILIVALLIIWSLVWTLLGQALLSQNVIIRCLLVAATLLPLAMCMGIPFPQALATVGQASRREMALAWCVNGVMTVVGSVLAVVLSIMTGFTAVAVLSGCAYLVATLILSAARKQEGQ